MSEFVGPTEGELAEVEAAEVEGCPEDWVPSDDDGGASADGKEVSWRG